MLKRLGCVLLIAAIGFVAIAWSKAAAVPAPAHSVTPRIFVPSNAKPCAPMLIDRATVA